MAYLEHRRLRDLQALAQQSSDHEADPGDAFDGGRRRQGVRTRSPEVHTPSGAVAVVSSSHGAHRSLVEFEGPYAHGEGNDELKRYVDEISTNFWEILIDDREDAVSMSTTWLFNLSIQDSFKAGARANLAAMRVTRDRERLRGELENCESSRTEETRLLREAHAENQSLKSDLASEREVFTETLAKFNDLVVRIQDSEELKGMLKACGEYENLEKEILNYGIDYAVEHVNKRHPTLDLSFFKKYANAPL